MWFFGVKTGHLLEQDQHFAKPLPGHVLLKEFSYRPVVRLNARWQPLNEPASAGERCAQGSERVERTAITN